MPDYDSMLFRKIRTGNEYDHLIPKEYCKPVYVGEGMTDFTIDAMEEGILEYAWQTEKLADVLQKQTLNSTALAIHEFLYNHFQYHADKSDQMLRSAACSWYTRKEGIDCKSYSIFASCLLLNLGITHYIRKIKQPGESPDHYTHVYVIVPIDQPNGKLDKGYYTIDGTLKYTQEPTFLGKSDLKMEGMKHYFLNGASSTSGLNGGISLSSLQDLSKQISIKNIKSIFGKIDCLGGSSLTADGAKLYYANIDKFYQDWAYQFNVAIQQDNTQLTSFLVAKFKGMSIVFENASVRNRNTGWNSCTSSRIDGATLAFRFYRDVVGQVLDAYMLEYFSKVSGTFPQDTNFTSADAENLYGFRHTNMNPPSTNTQPKQMFNPILTKAIPAFNLPKYVIDQANAGQPLDLKTVLGLLETAGNVLKTVAPSTGNTFTPIKGDGSFTFTPINSGSNTKTAGIGTIAGIGIALFGAAVIFGKMKDTGPGAKKTTRKPTTKAK